MKIPLSLSIYEHAARFINETPWNTSRSAELMYRAHREAYLCYRHSPLVVGIDIYNLEAECYGCKIEQPDGNGVPAVIEHPFTGSVDALRIESFDPIHSGRIPLIMEVTGRLQTEFPEADIRIPVSGPFSIAQNLIGLEQLVMETALSPEPVRKLLDKLVEGQLAWCREINSAGFNLAFFESAAAPPLISPATFRDVELPPLKQAMSGVSRILGHPVPCIIGGDTTLIIDHMLETGTDFLICPSEADRGLFLDRMKNHPEIKVRINMKPEIYVRGNHENISSEIEAIIKLAAGRENILLGTGAIPFETPIENILFIKDYASKNH